MYKFIWANCPMFDVTYFSMPEVTPDNIYGTMYKSSTWI